MVLNVYNFDKTIYDGDSANDFFLFSLKKDIKLIRFLPRQFFGFILYKLKIISKTEYKERFFSFLKAIENEEEHINSFWIIHEKKIRKWFFGKKERNDVVVSDSPEFLLDHICKELKINHLVASKVCIRTGIHEGKTCYGQEKADRFFEKFPDDEIDNFYFSSVSDLPLVKKSKAAFLVRKDKIVKYISKTSSVMVKLKKYFLNIRFVKFFIVGLLNAINGVVFASLFSLLVKQANIAFILGYILALCISYLLNTFFVFSEKSISFNKYLKFCISYIPNFVLQNAIVYALSVFSKIPEFVMYAISGAISFPLTYMLLSCFTFKKTK